MKKLEQKGSNFNVEVQCNMDDKLPNVFRDSPVVDSEIKAGEESLLVSQYPMVTKYHDPPFPQSVPRDSDLLSAMAKSVLE
jgi:hypothetical protein